MPDWLDKAKEAAKKAAAEAKNLAEKAKNADYGSMLEKTKSMAQGAAEEARKAAEGLTKKGSDEAASAEQSAQETPSELDTSADPKAAVVKEFIPVAQDTSEHPDYKACLQKLQQVEAILQEIKQKL